MGAWQYDDEDIHRLSTIMTLHDVGFSMKKWRSTCGCCWKGKIRNRNGWRLSVGTATAMDEIHFKQTQLDRLDYLRYKIQKAGQAKNE